MLNVTKRLRLKEQDLDYRFMEEPDLPVFYITKEQIESVDRMATPFEEKLRLLKTYKGLKVNEVISMFNIREFIPVFERLASKNKPKLVFNWLYSHFLGQCLKIESEPISNLRNICQEEKLGDLIGFIEEKKISSLNGKKILYILVNGSPLTVSEIATENNLFE